MLTRHCERVELELTSACNTHATRLQHACSQGKRVNPQRTEQQQQTVCQHSLPDLADIAGVSGLNRDRSTLLTTLVVAYGRMH